MQAELLALLMSFISKVKYWYPQTLYYLSHGATFPFFIRAAQRRHFANLALITGVKTGDELRSIVAQAYRHLPSPPMGLSVGSYIRGRYES